MRTLSSARLRAIALPISLFAVIACGGPSTAADRTPTPASSPADPVGAVATPTPAGPTADPSPIATPAPTSAPTATPVPRTPTGTWAMHSIPFKGSCTDATATVDGATGLHVTASCDGVIRYAASSDGQAWKAVHFSLPAHRWDVTPQVAVDGSTLYLAYTRLRTTDGGCGDDGLTDVGVYYRTRHLPGGTWSAPVRIGRAADHLQGFRVLHGVIHETFTSADGSGPVSYGRLERGRYHASVIPGAMGTSLRVGDDGRARIAFTTGSAIRFAVAARDASLSIRTIFRSTDMQLGAPSMVLGPGNHAYMAWTAHEIHQGGGCAEPEPPTPSKPGTYFASDATGSWSVRWISKIIADPSISMDTRTGRVDVVVSYSAGIRQLTRAADGTWSGRLISGSRNVEVLLLRGIPKTGGLLLIGVVGSDVSGGSLAPSLVALVQS